jgi:hypothetical protein
MLLALVSLNDPEFVATILKLPAMVAPFNPPFKFTAAVCEGQFHVKLPNV